MSLSKFKLMSEAKQISWRTNIKKYATQIMNMAFVNPKLISKKYLYEI